LRLKRGVAILGGFLIFSTAFCLIFSQQILWWMGAALVASESPRKSDIEIVLGGDKSGNRILKSCELLQAGYAPRVLVSGEGSYYGTHESVLAINLAVSKGCPREAFTAFRYPATSTTDEAAHIVTELRRLGIHSVLVVTSPSHTARARRVFRRLGPDLDVHTVAARDINWNNGYWWKLREGRKIWLLESVKTLADFIGL